MNAVCYSSSTGFIDTERTYVNTFNEYQQRRVSTLSTTQLSLTDPILAAWGQPAKKKHGQGLNMASSVPNLQVKQG